MKLTINNIGAIHTPLKGTGWYCPSIGTASEFYSIRLIHEVTGISHSVMLYRDGYLTGGAWHFSVKTEHQTGQVSWGFLRKPENLVQHILLLLK